MKEDISDKIIQLIRSRPGVVDIGGVLRKNSTPLEMLHKVAVTLSEKGETGERLLHTLDQVIENSVNTNHGFFMNQMYGKQQPFAVLGDILTTLLNTSMYTYEVAPVMTLIEKEGILNESFAVDADYLFHDNDDFDLGQKSLQCGRRVDALKLWLAWKHEGDSGFAKRIDELMQLSYTMADKIRLRKELELLYEPESAIVCFRYVDERLSSDQLNILNRKIRETIFNRGRFLFNYSFYKDKIYLRCVISDPAMGDSQLERILGEIVDVGKRLGAALLAQSQTKFRMAGNSDMHYQAHTTPQSVIYPNQYCGT